MNESEAKTLIERFAKKQQGGHFACPRWKDGDGRGERHAQRTEPQSPCLCVRCLRDNGGFGGYDGQPDASLRMGHHRHTEKLAHGGELQ